MRQPDQSSIDQYFAQGFAILPNWLEPLDLKTLSDSCDALLAEPPDDDQSGRGHNIGKGADRRFLAHRHRDFPNLEAFVTGPDMGAFLRPFLGPTPHLFNEQFVVKGPRTGAAFGWHQDGGYVGFDHAPYLSVWIAIDDTTAENGPLFVLPRDLRNDAALVPHHWDDTAREMVGYTGPEPGISAVVPSGSVVLFSSVTLHRSSTNSTDRVRRAYLAQYSGQPLIDPATGAPKRFATAL